MPKLTKINDKENFFIGIDLGGREKKTSGICILRKTKEGILPDKNWCIFCQDFYGKDVLNKIKKYLKEIKVIAIDAPLTKGKGKGKMRLYEKFLSTKFFKKEKVSPIPPALMPELSNFGQELVKILEKKGFVLDLNLIEVFPTLVEKICGQGLSLKIIKERSLPCKTENHPFDRLGVMVSSSNHQKSALICAILAVLHSQFKTRYLGYKDGFLFLPEVSFWKKSWMKKFFKNWKERPRLKYHHLITNIFY
jgi:predicted nuclease with RNAse H fold